MLFNTGADAIFCAAVWLSYLTLGHKWQNRLLLVASYVLYGRWDYRFYLLLLLSTVVDDQVGLRTGTANSAKTRKRLLFLSLARNLGVSGFFKYFDFFTVSAAQFLIAIGLQADTPTRQIILPVVISFYTFRTLSYTIVIYRGKDRLSLLFSWCFRMLDASKSLGRLGKPILLQPDRKVAIADDGRVVGGTPMPNSLTMYARLLLLTTRNRPSSTELSSKVVDGVG